MSKEFVVTQDIPFGSVFAYRKGDKVTADAVEQNGWQDYVASPTSKEAKQIRGEASGEPSAEKP